jgi:ABC-type transport system involved in multi-copper enzyme maturation permease subunit
MSRDAAVPLHRLVHVEFRKIIDTRAGMWMCIVVAAVTALFVALVLMTSPPEVMEFSTFVQITGLPLMMLLPILGIMAATAEWSQRTGLMTFTLEPRRGRVVSAKLIAGVLLGLALITVSLVVAALANVAAIVTGGSGSWAVPWTGLLGLVVGLTIFVLQGFGFGFTLLNTPAAIVAALVIPTAWSIASSMVGWIEKLGVWLDLNRVLDPLMAGSMSATDWQHLGTGVLAWVGIPLTIGIWRVMTREVK